MFKRGLTTFLGNSMRWLELSPSNSENIIFTIFLQLSESFGFIIALDEQREIYGSFSGIMVTLLISRPTCITVEMFRIPMTLLKIKD